MARTFEDSPAVRRSVPLFVGLVGPSGSGKTKSALRLAVGMQRVCGGEICGVDTESNRMLHYADDHKFRHVPFVAPFDPLSYLAAIEHCLKKGAKTIIVDSASHLHEGPGGTLEAHEAELTRMAGNDHSRRQKMTMLAWQKPKKELRQFLNAVLQMNVNIIFCYRAKEKMKLVPGKEPQRLGFMPIAGDEMVYEATINMLLYPGSGGVPSWHPDEIGERAIVKLPGQFRELFKQPRPLDEGHGEELAKWAAGGAAPVASEQARQPPRASAPARASQEDIKALSDLLVRSGMNDRDQRLAWMKEKSGGKALNQLTADDVSNLAQIAKELEGAAELAAAV